MLSGGRTLSYEYDAEERITKVTDSVDGVTQYTYDAMGQLLTETVNDVAVNTMVYDNYGNIVSKNGKAYTYGDAVPLSLHITYDNKFIFAATDSFGMESDYMEATFEYSDQQLILYPNRMSTKALSKAVSMVDTATQLIDIQHLSYVFEEVSPDFVQNRNS